MSNRRWGLKLLRSLQFLETQMLHMKKEIAVYQTAQSAYFLSLKMDIENMGIRPSEDKSPMVE